MTVFERPVLVTGAAGCIGAWVVAALVEEGSPVLAYDTSENRRRLALLLGDEAAAAVPWQQGDIADLEALDAAAEAGEVGAIVHLAALQVPLCKANPSAGARTNVVGQVNVLEVARRRGIERLVYASSVAALTPQGAAGPATLYGVYKAADEGIARLYWQDWSVPSVGLRPHSVYGLGRDQGLTAAPTKAMLAAAAGRPFTIPFSGRLQLHFARDLADIVLRCARAAASGAPVLDVGGPAVSVAEIIAAIGPVADGAEIDSAGPELPFPHDRDKRALEALIGPLDETPLEEGVAATIAAFRSLLAEGRIEAG